MQISEIPLLVAYEKDAIFAIQRILRANRKLIVAYSGGKDSTAVLLMVLNAAKALREEGITFPPILITHGNTGIENPTVVELVHSELAKARAFGLAHGFEVQAEIATPLLNDTWAVAIIGGRKLPTFANASSRDCTVMFKIDPMKRLRNRILKQEKGERRGGPPVTLIGTRFEESTGRSERMTERGETAYEPWVQKKAWYMSPIANWTSDDVWEYIGQYKNGQSHGFTDGVAVWEMYADAGATGTCAIVADMATEGAKKSRACGARFGCAMCGAVGRDKSLENMLMQPQYSWLRNLNRIQRFIVDTQWDWSRRNWVGRSINKGYVKIQPDTYSPAMMQELLRYCLTADIIEERAARAKGIAPRFQLVSEEQLLAIDALWSLNGLQERPFTAVKIWDEVHREGKRFFPPEIDPVPRTPQPAARYMFVGSDWDGGTYQPYTGLRSALHDLAADEFGGSGCVGRRLQGNGIEVMDVDISKSFGFDAEAMSLFFEFEMEYALENFYDNPYNRCTSGFFHYVGLNMIQTSEGHVKAHVDRIMRRTSWKLRNGLVGELSREILVAKSMSKAEMLADRALRSEAEICDVIDADDLECDELERDQALAMLALNSQDDALDEESDKLDMTVVEVSRPVAPKEAASLPKPKAQQLTFEFA